MKHYISPETHFVSVNGQVLMQEFITINTGSAQVVDVN